MTRHHDIHIDPACAVYLFLALPLSAVIAVAAIVWVVKAVGGLLA